ncbi:MAG TPA: HAMP domain-containing protein [Salinivirgaceae bacterium]|nr:HAMP domain-containing protein [Salinivirgaceae bacterium]
MKNTKTSLKNKLLIPIVLTSTLIFIISFSLIVYRTHTLAVNDAKKFVESTAREYATLVKFDIEKYFNISQTLATVLEGYLANNPTQTVELTQNLLQRLLEKNPRVYATWVSYELRGIDPTWKQNFGRRRITAFRDGAETRRKDELVDLNGDNVQGAYYFSKTNKKPIITDPYYFSYTGGSDDEILETSLGEPLIINDQFYGLAGVDISLETLNNLVDTIRPFPGAQAILLSNNSQIIAFGNKKYIGKFFHELNKSDNQKYNVEERIKNGEIFSYETNFRTGRYFVIYQPILLGRNAVPWSLQIATPLNVIYERSVNNVYLAIVMGLLGLIILVVLIWYISRRIISPIGVTTNTLKIISEGAISKTSYLEIDSGDEIETMAQSLNKLIESLKQTTQFAQKIGKGDLSVQYTFMSDDDEIGKALVEMQRSLQRAYEEEQKRKIEDEKQRWTSEGIAMLGDILHRETNSLDDLAYSIIVNLVKYMDVEQGSIYTMVDEEIHTQEPYLEMKSAVAFDRRRLLKGKFHIGEGLVGRCAHEKCTIYMIDIPDEFVYINSGMGEAKPRSVLLVPLMLNDTVFGVIELVSFKYIDDYKIKFVEKISESVAGTLSNARINERTKRLLQDSQRQRQELTSQEEELRQNLEELQAIQEDAARRESEIRSMLKLFGEIALIIEYDTDMNVLTINEQCMEYFGEKPESMITLPHRALGFVEDRNPVEHAAFIRNVKSNNVVKRKSTLVTRVKQCNMFEIYSPLYNNEGIVTRYISAAIDLSKIEHIKK